MFKKQSTAEFAAKIKDLERELEFAQKSSLQKEFGEFLGSLQAQAKITAEDKNCLEKVLSILAEPKVASFCAENKLANWSADFSFDTQNFSEQGENDFAAGFLAFLSNLPARCEFAELATRKNAPKGTYSTPFEEMGMKLAASVNKKGK